MKCNSIMVLKSYLVYQINSIISSIYIISFVGSRYLKNHVIQMEKSLVKKSKRINYFS